MQRIVSIVWAVFMVQSLHTAQAPQSPDEIVTHSPAQNLSIQKLINAAYAGEVTNIIAALNEGAPVDTQDENGLTSLMWATQQGHMEAIRTLIAAGADLLAQDDQGYTAFLYAKDDKVTALLFAIAQEKLFQAIAQGDVNMVTQLINAGLEVDTKDPRGTTALMFAIQMDAEEIVEKLIALGANVNARDYAGGYPLKYAINNPSLLRALLQVGATITPELKLRARNNQKIKEIIEPYIKLHEETALGELMQAAIEGNVYLIAELIMSGIDVNSKDIGGWTALDWALFSKQPKTVEYLLQRKAIPSKLSFDIAEKNDLMKALLSNYYAKN